MTTTRGVLWICVALIHGSIAAAQGSAASKPAAPPPAAPGSETCLDTPVVDGQPLPGESLPVHARIAEYLASRPPGADYSCKSQQFVYEARHEGTSIKVTSRYVAGGRPHAEIVFSNERNVGGFRAHSAVRVLWPDGKPQAFEYHCYGWPVGFHRYFDKAGALRAVADYSKSDYHWHQVPRGRHTFRRGGSTLGNPDIAQSLTLFSELYSVSGAAIKREQFRGSSLFLSRRWTELDPASTVQQWTREGDQGTVALLFKRGEQWDYSNRWELNNAPMEYVLFAATYQRARSKQPGRDPAVRFNTDVLECPWIDEAMRFASEDKRFAFAPVTAVSAADRDASPRARYRRCVEGPTLDCLLEFGIDQGKAEKNQGDLFLRAAAAVAVRSGQPQHALAATNEALGRTYGYPLPNPLFAGAAALKAHALALLGDKAASGRTLEEAYVHATTRQAGYEGRNGSAVMLTAPTLAHLGRFEEARKAYELAVADRAPRAYEVLGELGIAYARAGRIDAALNVAQDLRRPPAVAAAPEERPGDEQRANAVRALTGNPFAARSRNQTYFHAMAALAQGAAERGAADDTRSVLAEVEAGLKAEPGTSSVTDMIRAAAAAAYARVGDAGRAQELLRPIKNDAARAWSSSAGSLCGAGRAGEAQALLKEAESVLRMDVAPDLAHVGHAYAKCGMKDKAQELFVRAREIADNTPGCRGDVCGPFKMEAQQAVAARIIDAGYVDLAAASQGLGPSNELRLAVAQARQGDIPGGMRRFNAIAAGAGGQASVPLRDEIARARAELAAIRGQRNDARGFFTDAFRVAKAIENTNQRAVVLAHLGEAQARSGFCDSARWPLDEARAAIDRTLLSGAPPIAHDQARAIAAPIAQTYAFCNYMSEARQLARALTTDVTASSGRNRAAAVLADAVAAQVAVARADRRGATKALTELEALPPIPAKLKALLDIDAIVAKGADAGEQRSAKAMLARQGQTAADYFLAAETDFERRLLIGYFAQFIRAAQKPDAQTANTLFSLLVEESTRLNAPNWKARALCELGYTAKATGRDDSQRLFDAGMAPAKAHRTRTFPLDPPPTGACAYWLKLAQDESRARTLMEQHTAALRSESDAEGTRFASPTTLLSLAVSAAEAEHGELLVEWPKLVH